MLKLSNGTLRAEYFPSTLNAQRSTNSAFTLIEILVVCGILGILMTIAFPMLHSRLHPDSMKKVADDMKEACCHARAYAILQGTPVDLVISAEDGSVRLQPAANESTSDRSGTFSPSVSGGAWRMEDQAREARKSSIGDDASMGERPARSAAPTEALNFSSKIPDKIAVELVEVNFTDAMEWAEVRVRFYPNGTSDEFKLLLYRPDTGERRLLTLEVVTALVDVESDMMKMK